MLFSTGNTVFRHASSQALNQLIPKQNFKTLSLYRWIMIPQRLLHFAGATLGSSGSTLAPASFLPASLGVFASRPGQLLSVPFNVRTMSSLSNANNNISNNDDNMKNFKLMLPLLIKELSTDGPYRDLPLFPEYLKKCLEYNLANGKLTRGLAVTTTFKLMSDPAQQTPEALTRAIALGWCVELLQAFFLVTDDVMDGSVTRRGQACWHRLNGVGMNAVNDANHLHAAIYYLVEKYLGGHRGYHSVLQSFLKCGSRTFVGQTLDMMSMVKRVEGSQADFGNVSMDLYNNIVKYKTSYYSFCLPVEIGMRLAGIEGEDKYMQAEKILLEIGNLFQVQDDFIDCFGDETLTGKIGTDIREGKCSWLIVKALEVASIDQVNILKECYASSNPEDVKKVKDVYNSLELTEIYRLYEEETYNNILRLIQEFCGAEDTGGLIVGRRRICVVAGGTNLLHRQQHQVDKDDDGESGGSALPWKVAAAVLVERLPAVTPKLPEFHRNMLEMLRTVEEEGSILSEFELRLMNDLEEARKRRESGDKVILAGSRTATDDLDSWTKELASFKSASLLTDADRNKDLRNTDRELDKSLHLVVRRKLGGNHEVWDLPTAIVNDGETLRQAAGRAVAECCGHDLALRILGNSPWAFYKYKYPRKFRESLKAKGEKVFILKALLEAGNASLPSDNASASDFKWLIKDEMLATLDPKTSKAICDMTYDDFTEGL